MFYRQKSDKNQCRKYLLDRLTKEESIIFISRSTQSEPQGFTLLYPLFSSVAMGRTYLLNDLYVSPQHRKKGVASALLSHAKNWAKQQQGLRMHLETEVGNLTAQRLYEQLGWQREKTSYHYFLEL